MTIGCTVYSGLFHQTGHLWFHLASFEVTFMCWLATHCLVHLYRSPLNAEQPTPKWREKNIYTVHTVH